jgi:hypothetical protein
MTPLVIARLFYFLWGCAELRIGIYLECGWTVDTPGRLFLFGAVRVRLRDEAGRLVGSAFPPGFAQVTCRENTSSLSLRKLKAGVHGKVHY